MRSTRISRPRLRPAPTRASISAPQRASSRPNRLTQSGFHSPGTAQDFLLPRFPSRRVFTQLEIALEFDAGAGHDAGADITAERVGGAVQIGVDISDTRRERPAGEFDAERPIPFAPVKGAALAAEAGKG